MIPTPSPLDSAGAKDWRTYLEHTALALPEFGCYVAISEDRRTIFSCPTLADGSPEPDEGDSGHVNWCEVTAPDPEFLDAVNVRFGTIFTLDGFDGR